MKPSSSELRISLQYAHRIMQDCLYKFWELFSTPTWLMYLTFWSFHSPFHPCISFPSSPSLMGTTCPRGPHHRTHDHKLDSGNLLASFYVWTYQQCSKFARNASGTWCNDIQINKALLNKYIWPIWLHFDYISALIFWNDRQPKSQMCMIW